MVTAYFTASSLDGFITDEHNELGWLFKQPIDANGPMHYGPFIDGVGALVMGATTYLWIKEHHVDAGDEWGYSQPAWVMTHRDLPVVEGADVRFRRGPVAPVHAEMTAAAGGKALWVVGGGDLAGQFADAGLLDEVWVQYAPVTLRGGAPLLPRALDLELLEIARNEAFLCGRYRVVDQIDR
ncbi:dihydrofolate reductase family protein [Nocardioides sp. CER19]|uniref:dihydrofolate reductase family protein n=1 Tax=Nocardioides sp. CER19 TaxID=3038538 RepID=UPI00244A8A8E|nr:dihydrofolate reductase family protein [Nocardioides sp. CER19]MDH2414708.1 dihydrofolate reductase family protein [Nocardioides sp. CER19]